MSRFTDKFMIGASTAAHQVEGSNTNSDYWAMEHLKHTNFNEPSLNAVDHYNRYEEDIRLMAEAGLNTYRFSIEWARIEPEEGNLMTETEHYRKVLKCCRNHGVEPVVTMMHFTSPVWLIQKGGWESESTVKYFVRYCAYLRKNLETSCIMSSQLEEVKYGLQVAAIAERYKRQMMAKRRKGKKSKKDKNMEGTAQVGMNFNKMLKNMFWQGFENKKVFEQKNRRSLSVQEHQKEKIFCNACASGCKRCDEKGSSRTFDRLVIVTS